MSASRRPSRRPRASRSAGRHGEAVEVEARLAGGGRVEGRVDVVRPAFGTAHAQAAPGERAHQARASRWSCRSSSAGRGDQEAGRAHRPAPRRRRRPAGSGGRSRRRRARSRGSPPRPSAGPTRISAVRSMPASATSSASVGERAAERSARPARRRGTPPPPGRRRRRTGSARRDDLASTWIERWIASVAPVAAKAARRLALRHGAGPAGGARQDHAIAPRPAGSARAAARRRPPRRPGRPASPCRGCRARRAGASARPARSRSTGRRNGAAPRPARPHAAAAISAMMASRSRGAVSTIRAPGGHQPRISGATSEPA